MSTLTSAAQILLIKTSTRGSFLNFQHIATAYIKGNFLKGIVLIQSCAWSIDEGFYTVFFLHF